MGAAFAYILCCADGQRYYGSTNDLRRRLKDHRRGHVKTTSCRLPIELVYFEEFQTQEQARKRERAFKNGRTRRTTLDRLIADFDPKVLAAFGEPSVSRAGAS